MTGRSASCSIRNFARSGFGVSLSLDKAQAATRVVVRPYVRGPYSGLSGNGLPWYAVRAYYADRPWSGLGYSWAEWSDYAARNGTVVKGGDGILYMCQ
jgi:hypothetical protein